MHALIEEMLEKYHLQTIADGTTALREIIQEIALVGLWRAKFFEHAAFYGGTALRILYGLDRFSEDLDFSLLKPDPVFSLSKYNHAIKDELSAFGFEVTVIEKIKNIETPIESAFIKANTKTELIHIGLRNQLIATIPKDAVIKIKLEIDTNPPSHFKTEAKVLKEPMPVFINVYAPSDLFAGKMHALLFRGWSNRIKGRDWYDFVWFVKNGISLNLDHLEKRMWQSGHLPEQETLTKENFLVLLKNKIEGLNVEKALLDIKPFLKDQQILKNWSNPYFLSLMADIKYES